MTHDETRALLSAVADGETARTPDLDAHLASCADCRGYSAALDRLSVLTRALPRERAPETLAQRVTRRIRRRRRAWRFAPALAATTAVLVALPLLPGPGAALVPLPPAAAAEPLLRLRSVHISRTITEGSVVTSEKIWWRAPGYLRIEREIGEPGSRQSWETLHIETPFLRYDDGDRTDDPVPRITLPEPLTPTVALIGTDRGPGPVVAGLPTRTYEVFVDDQRRTAHVADGISLGGTDTSIVLSKTGAGGTEKTTQRVEYDVDVPDSLFEPPPARGRDGGFRDRDLGDLDLDPERRPQGFAVVRAGSGPDGEVVLFANGSLPVLVRTGGLRAEGPSEVRTVFHGGQPYLVGVHLYDAPSVQVTTRRGVVTVSAPLPLPSLVALAVGMYGLE